MKIQCRKCEGILIHDPRRLIGCLCDPDSPTWCWIEPSGEAKGLGQAEWDEVVPEDSDDFWKWMKEGFDRGWVGETFCWSHDLPENVSREMLEQDTTDPCVYCLPILRQDFDGSE